METATEACLAKGIIDTHCHILPGLDDGAGSVEEALHMGRIALDQGIKTVFVTPHHGKKHYYNPPPLIALKIKELQGRLIEANIPLTLLPGQEFHLNRDYRTELLEQNYQTLGNSSYLLIELPDDHIPQYFDDFLEELRVRNVIPVLAHPERNHSFIKKPSLLAEWGRKGVFAQVTSQSIVGLFGLKVQRIAIQMCSNGWVQLLASDAHNTRTRQFWLKDAYERLVSEKCEMAAAIFQDNAELLLRGERLIAQPVEGRSNFRKLWKWGGA
ncbi:tyrosine-protein phosphatase [Paenibacillus sp. R14(2021)]|uniref:tyrosine-protein phosphatase n=1 Tax=Paenibacillus sp. R14(2021) TaxID=2859228 RepID=UPI001C6165F8|nr:CpsB/CapC family capsule biosynthesis tyrosine phosphatase [Paenibacillus sp. R14(2021)]